MTKNFYDKEYFEGRNSNYWWTIGNYKNLRDAPHWGEMLRIIKGIKGNGKLLDIGCAYGFLVDATSSHLESYGVDISNFAIKKSKDFCDGSILMASAANLPFKENSFDIITVIDTLEHIVKLDECVRHIARTLKKDGVLFLQLPNPLIWRYLFGFFKLRDRSHVNDFWLKKWKRTLSKNGLKVDKCYGIVVIVFKRAKFFLKSETPACLFPEWWVIAKK